MLSKKICLVTAKFAPDVGGVAKASARLVQFLLELKMTVHVFCYKNKEVVKDESLIVINQDLLTIHRLDEPKNAGFSTKYYVPLYKKIKDIDQQISFDLFHGFMLHMAFPCLMARGNSNRPVIASIRGIETVWMLEDKFNTKIFRYIIDNSDWITTVAKDGLEILKSLNKNYLEKASFIPNSIETTGNIRWQLQNSNKGVVGTVGIFREKKNLPLLIKAYHRVNPKIRKKLLLVGDFVENEECGNSARIKVNQLIKDLGLENEVEITGFINNRDIQRYFQEMNVFVLSSDQEGMPNAALEAASVGLPVIATNADGIKDIFTHGKDSLISPVGDIEKLSHSIEKVLSDLSVIETLSAGAIHTAEKFNPQYERQLWLDTYQNCLMY